MELYKLLQKRKLMVRKYWDAQVNTRISKTEEELIKNEIIEKKIHDQLAKLENEIQHEINMNY